MSKKNASNRPSAETINPLSVPRYSRETEQGRLQRRHQLGIVILICCVIFLIAAGAWFLHYLSNYTVQSQPVTNQKPAGQPEPPAQRPAAQPQPPIQKQAVQPQTPAKKQAERPDQATRTATPPETPPPTAVDPETPARDRQAAEQTLADFIETKKKLDDKGAAEWGGEPYLQMVESGRRADTLFINKEYIPASEEYTRATNMGRQLDRQTGEALQRLLEAGRAALSEGKGDVARSNFKVALLIDPANRSAQKGLKRSQTIEKVFQLIEAGKQHENDNALIKARNEYRQALQIDPDAHEARQELDRVTHLIKEQQFRQMLSAGLTAFHNNDFALARSSLLKAKSLKPGSREVSEALVQVDQAQRLARIDQLRTVAQKAEDAEDWQAALAAHLAVLEIDKNLQFAVRGKERAKEQIYIAKRLDYYLSQPRVLESDKQLKSAVLLLHEANEVTPRGQRLTRRTEELAKRIKDAQTPVIVTIESDNLTRIAVYKVGKLGQFSQRVIKLRPGTYTVVGARDGFQDVRRKIVVKPGQQALRVTVKCTVKI